MFALSKISQFGFLSDPSFGALLTNSEPLPSIVRFDRPSMVIASVWW